MRRQSAKLGITSLIISSLYWACIYLPARFWPVFCPWGHSTRNFVICMLTAIVLGIVAGAIGARLWFLAAVFAAFSLMMGASTL